MATPSRRVPTGGAPSEPVPGGTTAETAHGTRARAGRPAARPTTEPSADRTTADLSADRPTTELSAGRDTAAAGDSVRTDPATAQRTVRDADAEPGATGEAAHVPTHFPPNPAPNPAPNSVTDLAPNSGADSGTTAPASTDSAEPADTGPTGHVPAAPGAADRGPTASGRTGPGPAGPEPGEVPPSPAPLTPPARRTHSAPGDASGPEAEGTGDGHRAAYRLLSGALRHSAGRVALLTLATTGSAVAHLVLPAALGRTLDLLLADPESARTHHWLLGCVALTVAIVVLDACDVALTAGTNARATAWIRRRAVRHTLDAGPRSGGPPAGDLVARLVGSAAQAGTAPAALAATFSSVITPVGGVCALALIDPWTAVGLLVGLPLFGLLLRGFVRDSGDSLTRYQRTQGEIAGRLTEALDGARTIAAAGTARREISRVLGPLPALSREGHRVWRVQSRSTAQAAALVPMLQITVIAVAGIRLDAGALSVGSLLAASRYAVLATGFGGLVGRLGALVRARTAAARVAELLAAPVIPHGDRTLPPGDGTVELRAVTLSTGGRTVLDGVDLALPGGTSTAVVGRSGAGKSALAAVAGRLADPDRGTVLLDGVPLPELTRAEIRGAIAYAFARPALLGGTLHGTIALGVTRPPASGVARAARAACADGFISRLPDGYATPCAGVLLSGGEIQRLGLARAFAHDGRLMVLDDATSSLDSVTELRVARALAREEGHRTRLIVAHRATTAARADRVVWLEEGRVRAVAPHAELWRIPDYRAVFAPPDPDPERDPLVDTAPVPGPLADAVPGPGRTSAGGGAQRPGGTGTFAGPGPSGGAGAGDADG